MPEVVQGIATSAILEELQRLACSVPFRRSRRLRSFLEFTVQKVLRGELDGLKEYSIGVEVFNKPESFDARLDSIVRVEARRLRAAVERYYSTDGADSEIMIRFRPGSYAPTFRERSSLTPLEQSGKLTNGTSQMLVLVGDSHVLNGIRQDLSEKIGLLQTEIGLAAAGFGTSRSLTGEFTVPVFYVGQQQP
ncbi:MAG TPA: hypothetical protein VMZ52_02195 [Bryobacteraceae bacterium]|nr:hypothetical protein [Bryobacteraceae bacterium]